MGGGSSVIFLTFDTPTAFTSLAGPSGMFNTGACGGTCLVSHISRGFELVRGLLMIVFLFHADLSNAASEIFTVTDIV